MIQAELFEKIGQSAALAVGRDKTEPADQHTTAGRNHVQGPRTAEVDQRAVFHAYKSESGVLYFIFCRVLASI